MEMSRRELDVSLELREEIIAGFRCDQSTTVLNARDASQRNINYRGEQITAANVQEESVMRGDSGHLWLLWFCLFQVGGPLIGTTGLPRWCSL